MSDEIMTASIAEEKEIMQFNDKYMTVMKAVADIAIKKKELEKADKAMREQLEKAMDETGFLSIDNDYVTITYVAATTKTTIDSAAIKRKYPNVAEECSKTSPVKACIKIKVKGID